MRQSIWKQHSSRFQQRILAFALASGLMLSSSPAFAQTEGKLDTTQHAAAASVKGQVSISRGVNITESKEKVTLNLRDADLKDVLNMLAKQGDFNLILDNSVTGTLSVDIKDISINKALEYIFTINNLSYIKDGNTMIVASRAEATSKKLNARTFKAIPVLYKDASVIAGQLNSTLFSVQRPGGNETALAAFDGDSNSILITGSDEDIRLVGEALRELDVPRNRKVYHIKHNDPSYVAQVLAANFFTPGNTGTLTSGSATATVSTTTAPTANPALTAAASGAATSGTGGGTKILTPPTLSPITVGGVTLIPETISGTLTVMGTDEQIALVDSIIEKVDVKRPQAVIEVALVEIQNSTMKTLEPTWGNINLGVEGRLQILSGGLANTISLNRSNLNDITDHLVDTFSISAEDRTVTGKVLANPTIVALDGMQSEISITDQVPTVSQTSTLVNGVQTISSTITTQDAGVNLTLTPQIFNDGSVVLSLQPEVTQPIRQFTAEDSAGTETSTYLLATRSMNLAAVRVKDGQTLVIGGLVRETAATDLGKTPFLSDLPIVGAMFRSMSVNDKSKTELVLMVTPHIVKEDNVTYFEDSTATQGKYTPNGMQPVSLPKYIGSKHLIPQSSIKPAVHAPQGQPANAAPVDEAIPLKPKASSNTGGPLRQATAKTSSHSPPETLNLLQSLDELLK